MLISLRHRFIFVANVKTGSTAIETALRGYADVVISESALGKHDSLAGIETRFPEIYGKVPRADFLVFGAMRDPLDLLLSLYRSHTKPDFAGSAVYTGDMSIEQFVSDWLPANAGQWAPQWTRLRNLSGAYDCDFLMDFAHLGEHFQMVLALLGLPPLPLAVQNESPPGPTREGLPPGLAERVLGSRAYDADLLRNRSGRLLRAPVGLAVNG